MSKEFEKFTPFYTTMSDSMGSAFDGAACVEDSSDDEQAKQRHKVYSGVEPFHELFGAPQHVTCIPKNFDFIGRVPVVVDLGPALGRSPLVAQEMSGESEAQALEYKIHLASFLAEIGGYLDGCFPLIWSVGSEQQMEWLLSILRCFLKQDEVIARALDVQVIRYCDRLKKYIVKSIASAEKEMTLSDLLGELQCFPAGIGSLGHFRQSFKAALSGHTALLDDFILHAPVKDVSERVEVVQDVLFVYFKELSDRKTQGKVSLRPVEDAVLKLVAAGLVNPDFLDLTAFVRRGVSDSLAADAVVVENHAFYEIARDAFQCVSVCQGTLREKIEFARGVAARVQGNEDYRYDVLPHIYNAALWNFNRDYPDAQDERYQKSMLYYLLSEGSPFPGDCWEHSTWYQRPQAARRFARQGAALPEGGLKMAEDCNVTMRSVWENKVSKLRRKSPLRLVEKLALIFLALYRTNAKKVEVNSVLKTLFLKINGSAEEERPKLILGFISSQFSAGLSYEQGVVRSIFWLLRVYPVTTHSFQLPKKMEGLFDSIVNYTQRQIILGDPEASRIYRVLAGADAMIPLNSLDELEVFWLDKRNGGKNLALNFDFDSELSNLSSSAQKTSIVEGLTLYAIAKIRSFMGDYNSDYQFLRAAGTSQLMNVVNLVNCLSGYRESCFFKSDIRYYLSKFLSDPSGQYYDYRGCFLHLCRHFEYMLLSKDSEAPLDTVCLLPYKDFNYISVRQVESCFLLQYIECLPFCLEKKVSDFFRSVSLVLHKPEVLREVLRNLKVLCLCHENKNSNRISYLRFLCHVFEVHLLGSSNVFDKSQMLAKLPVEHLDRGVDRLWFGDMLSRLFRVSRASSPAAELKACLVRESIKAVVLFELFEFIHEFKVDIQSVFLVDYPVSELISLEGLRGCLRQIPQCLKVSSYDEFKDLFKYLGESFPIDVRVNNFFVRDQMFIDEFSKKHPMLLLRVVVLSGYFDALEKRLTVSNFSDIQKRYLRFFRVFHQKQLVKINVGEVLDWSKACEGLKLGVKLDALEDVASVFWNKEGLVPQYRQSLIESVPVCFKTEASVQSMALLGSVSLDNIKIIVELVDRDNSRNCVLSRGIEMLSATQDRRVVLSSGERLTVSGGKSVKDIDSKPNLLFCIAHFLDIKASSGHLVMTERRHAELLSGFVRESALAEKVLREEMQARFRKESQARLSQETRDFKKQELSVGSVIGRGDSLQEVKAKLGPLLEQVGPSFFGPLSVKGAPTLLHLAVYHRFMGEKLTSDGVIEYLCERLPGLKLITDASCRTPLLILEASLREPGEVVGYDVAALNGLKELLAPECQVEEEVGSGWKETVGYFHSLSPVNELFFNALLPGSGKKGKAEDRFFSVLATHMCRAGREEASGVLGIAVNVLKEVSGSLSREVVHVLLRPCLYLSNESDDCPSAVSLKWLCFIFDCAHAAFARIDAVKELFIALLVSATSVAVFSDEVVGSIASGLWSARTRPECAARIELLRRLCGQFGGINKREIVSRIASNFPKGLFVDMKRARLLCDLELSLCPVAVEASAVLVPGIGVHDSL